jgi:hypothetical protein
MSLESAATWLENLAIPTAIRDSGSLFPTLETIHVLALAVVVGSIATVDLRLIGLTQKDQPAWLVTERALPWTWGGFLFAAASGLLLFSSSAVKYAANPFLLIKFGLLALAGLNMAAFHYGAGRAMTHWPEGQAPNAARIAGGLSLVLWVAIVAAGRWIGFAGSPMPG